MTEPVLPSTAPTPSDEVPGPAARTRRRRTTPLAVAAALLVVLATWLAVVPVPYVVLGPGPTENTLGSVDGKPLITVTGHATYPTSGHLNLTTVGVTRPDARLTLLQALTAWFDTASAVVPRSTVYPPGQSSKESARVNAEEMTASQQHATVAAMRELGVRPVSSKIVVQSIATGAPALGRLKAGDVIVAVDGTPVRAIDDVRALIVKHEIGQSVRITVRRSGRTQVVPVPTIASPDLPRRPVIGIEPGVVDTYPFTVTIRLEDVGGPSAGLMFALGIIDKLTPGPLNAGTFVAGTGTIDDNGAVGEIGGIQQKMVAARRAGATTFFVPAGNCADAAPADPHGLRLVRVSSLKDALAALAELRSGRVADMPRCTR